MTSPASVIHLTTVHRADDVRILYKECRTLAAAGYRVVLLAPTSQESLVDGVQVRAVHLSSRGRLSRMTRGAVVLLRQALAENGDVYHIHDPELLTIGLLLKARRKKVVYDVHETVWKQILTKHWVPKVLRIPVAHGFRAFERLAALVLDGIIAATPAIARQFPQRKTVIVQNFAIMDDFMSIDIDDYPDRPSNVAYIGSIAKERGIGEMVHAMELLGGKATLQLGGVFNPSFLQDVVERQPGYEWVEFRGWLDRGGVKSMLAVSRVGLLTLHAEPNFLEAYPVKLFEYMSAGLPVVASNFPYWQEFVVAHGAGLMVDPLDPEEIASAIEWLLYHPKEAREMGVRGRSAAIQYYSWQTEAEKLLRAYAEWIRV